MTLASVFIITSRCYAEGWPQADFDIVSDGAILIDADSGAVLYEKNATTAYYPASITKVLTAILVLENCDNLEDKVTFSYAAVNTNLEPNSTIIGAVPGDKLSVRDCLYGLLLHSANDCANALAEYISKTNEKFADLMNEKAAELGCVNSHFVNPSGLNDPDHYTCAYDYAKIMQYAIKNETFRNIDATQAYTHAPITKYPNVDDSENTVYAHHHMMRKSYSDYYPGVFAGKTGYTTLAGNTLVTACERDGMTLITVILNGHSAQYSDTKKLFDFGYDNFYSISARSNDKNLNKLSSNMKVYGIQLIDSIGFDISPSYHITVPKGDNIDAVTDTLTYDLSDEEKSDGSFARIDYSYGDREVGKAYIKLSDNSLKTKLSRQLAEEASETGAVKLQEETIPETISITSNESDAVSDSGTEHPEAQEKHAPIVINNEDGRLEISKPIKQLLLILGSIALIAGVIFLVYFLFELREKYANNRRRSRMLKHTRDLSKAQKIRRDMLLNSRSRKKYPKR